MHGGMISSGALFVLAVALVLVSALVPSAAAAFIAFGRGRRRGFFMAALTLSVVASVIYECGVTLMASSLHWSDRIAAGAVVFGPVLVSTLGAVLVLRHFKYR